MLVWTWAGPMQVIRSASDAPTAVSTSPEAEDYILPRPTLYRHRLYHSHCQRPLLARCSEEGASERQHQQRCFTASGDWVDLCYVHVLYFRADFDRWMGRSQPFDRVRDE